jgi:hypothetical protein
MNKKQIFLKKILVLLLCSTSYTIVPFGKNIYRSIARRPIRPFPYNILHKPNGRFYHTPSLLRGRRLVKPYGNSAPYKSFFAPTTPNPYRQTIGRHFSTHNIHSNNPYEILGVPENATEKEIQQQSL